MSKTTDSNNQILNQAIPTNTGKQQNPTTNPPVAPPLNLNLLPVTKTNETAKQVQPSSVRRRCMESTTQLEHVREFC